jgi:hypothetical protein
MSDLFNAIEVEDQFVAFVSEKYTRAPAEIADVMHCSVVIDPERVIPASIE